MDKLNYQSRSREENDREVAAINDAIKDPLGLGYVPEAEYLETDPSGRLLETTLYKTGVTYFRGGVAGLAYGIYEGIRYREAGGMRVLLNNVLTKGVTRSIGFANQIGVIALMYQISNLSLNYLLSSDGDANIMIGSGALSGFLYTIRGSARKKMLGAIIGAFLATNHAIYERRIDVSGTIISKYRDYLDQYDDFIDSQYAYDDDDGGDEL